MKVRTIERSHTKAGPGRYHGQCRLITDAEGNVLGTRKPAGKRRIASYGGNWKGKPYLSMREHDMYTRLTRLYCDHPPMTTSQALHVIESARK